MVNPKKPWIIFLTIDYPLPPLSGCNWRTYAFAYALSNRYRIAIVAFGKAGSNSFKPVIKQVAGSHIFQDIHIFEKPRYSIPRQIYQILLSRWPFHTCKHRLPEVEELIDRMINQLNPRFIFVDHLNVMVNVPARHHVPLIFNEHNIEYSLYRPKIRIKGIYDLLQRIKTKRHEIRCFNKSTLVFVASEPDLTKVQSLGLNTPCVYIPNVIWVGERIKLDFKPTDAPCYLFVGTLSYRPNWEGLKIFITHIWPHVLSSLPNATFIVIGGTDKKHKFLYCNNIKYMGQIQDTDPYYRQCTATVIPLYSGGGTRLKILEAFAKGAPVISTSKGAEGLAVENDKNIILCDKRREFAEKLIWMAGNPRFLRELSDRAYDFVKKEHDFSVVDKIHPWIDKMIDGGAVKSGE